MALEWQKRKGMRELRVVVVAAVVVVVDRFSLKSRNEENAQ